MSEDLFQLLREDIKELRAELRAGFAQINGRVREAEQDIAVLKDRDGRKAALWGGGASAALIAMAEAIRAYFK